MAGGKGKINDYNKSLTPEQRKANASKAGKASRQKAYTMKAIAKLINNAPAQPEAKKGLKKLGLEDEQMTNSALIVAAIFRSAFEGDMKAIEKWEQLIDQSYNDENAGNGKLADLIDGLKEPCEDDIYTETESLDGAMADESTETN